MTLRAALPVAVKKAVWNIKYGLLKYQHSAAPINAIQYVCGHVNDDSCILELGCGCGSLLSALREAGSKSHYCGVDISRHAIDYARGYGDHRSAWVISDIESFDSPFQWNAILLIESVYYVDLQRLPLLLSRLRNMLTDDGFILVRIHDTDKHHEYFQALHRLAQPGARIDPTMLSIKRSDLKFGPEPAES
jgi:cyclopropane fatty-acyl-phospholipid synthase-like methyltransferase